MNLNRHYTNNSCWFANLERLHFRPACPTVLPFGSPQLWDPYDVYIEHGELQSQPCQVMVAEGSRHGKRPAHLTSKGSVSGLFEESLEHEMPIFINWVTGRSTNCLLHVSRHSALDREVTVS